MGTRRPLRNPMVRRNRRQRRTIRDRGALGAGSRTGSTGSVSTEGGGNTTGVFTSVNRSARTGEGGDCCGRFRLSAILWAVWTLLISVAEPGPYQRVGTRAKCAMRRTYDRPGTLPAELLRIRRDWSSGVTGRETYSTRSARMGSTAAARRAGTKFASRPTHATPRITAE